MFASPPIRDGRDFYIQPDDIATTDHFRGALGDSLSEAAAHCIVRLMKRKGGWEPFTQEEIEHFYNDEARGIGFSFHNLIAGSCKCCYCEQRRLRNEIYTDAIVLENGLYHVTDFFVLTFYKRRPARTINLESLAL